MTRRYSAVERPTNAGTILIITLRIKTAGIYKIIMISVNMDINNCQILYVSILNS